MGCNESSPNLAQTMRGYSSTRPFLLIQIRSLFRRSEFLLKSSPSVTAQALRNFGRCVQCHVSNAPGLLFADSQEAGFRDRLNPFLWHIGIFSSTVQVRPPTPATKGEGMIRIDRLKLLPEGSQRLPKASFWVFLWTLKVPRVFHILPGSAPSICRSSTNPRFGCRQ